jgi:hypothetical protein
VASREGKALRQPQRGEFWITQGAVSRIVITSSREPTGGVERQPVVKKEASSLDENTSPGSPGKKTIIEIIFQ